jgi:hypothetical protein
LTPTTTIQVPETKHVRDVLAKADEVGLELVEVSHERSGVETLKFRRDGYRLERVVRQARLHPVGGRQRARRE